MERRGEGRPSCQGVVRLRGEEPTLNGFLEFAGGAAAVAARSIALASVVLIAGAVAFRWLVLRRWPGEPRGSAARLAPLAATMGAWASAALLLDTPVRLVLQARLLVSPGDPVAPMAANVLGTTWGNGLALQAIAALAALAGFVLAKRARAAGWILALAAALALALSFSLMGHAVAPERGVALSVLDDWLHVLSAGGWTGTLAVVVTASMTLRRSDDGGAVLATVIALFHRVAMMCLVTLLASGTISVLLRVQHLRDLFGATYGTLLFAKLALVGVVAGFGWYHARTAESRARRAGTQSVARTLAVETGLAVLVILVTAVLVGTEPPGGM